MRIYFTQSQRLPLGTFNQIVEQAESCGHKVTCRSRSNDAGEVTKESTRKTFLDNHKKIISADIIIAECSYHSNGLGFDIAYSLEHSIPVIVLINLEEDTQNPFHINHVLSSIEGNTSRFILPKEYTTKTLTNVLTKALDEAENLTATKFNLILPFKINRFLEWSAKKKGKTKSDVTREAIEKMMDESKEYKMYFEGEDEK
jgi:predicted DNA-binding protein